MLIHTVGPWHTLWQFIIWGYFQKRKFRHNLFTICWCFLRQFDHNLVTFFQRTFGQLLEKCIFLAPSGALVVIMVYYIWWSDSLIVNLEVLFATLLEKLFWGFQWSRGFMLWPNKAMNTKICIRKFLGAFNNQNCWNCQHSHHHEVLSHLFPFCISFCMLYDRLKTL